MMRLNSKHLQLGLLIDFVKFSIDNLERAVQVHYDLNTKNENINDLIEIEKKQVRIRSGIFFNVQSKIFIYFLFHVSWLEN